MTNMFLIDTNILVYAFNAGSPFHVSSYKVVHNASKNPNTAVVSEKNLFEFYAIVTDAKRVEHPANPEDALNFINYIADSSIQILFSNQLSFKRTIELILKYSITRQEVFDIYLVGIMLAHNVKTIVTANDTHFRSISEITVVNPLVS